MKRLVVTMHLVSALFAFLTSMTQSKRILKAIRINTAAALIGGITVVYLQIANLKK